MYIDLNENELTILACALDTYQEALTEREKSADYFFRHYHEETKKQISEENRVMLHAKMLRTDNLKQKVLAYLA